jgi:hypothetical protein
VTGTRFIGLGDTPMVTMRGALAEPRAHEFARDFPPRSGVVKADTIAFGLLVF